MHRARWVIAGFAVGAAAAFAVGLLRKRRLVAQTGYVPPVSATGPEAVPEPTLVTSAAEPVDPAAEAD